MSNCIALQLDTPSGQDHDARVGGTIMDVVVWLRSLGLGKYEAAFRENDIDDTVLLTLSAEDLKELGVTSFGHRRKLVDAIAALRADSLAARAQQPAPPVVGFFGGDSPSLITAELVRAFRQGLKETGFVEGQTPHLNDLFNDCRVD